MHNCLVSRPPIPAILYDTGVTTKYVGPANAPR